MDEEEYTEIILHMSGMPPKFNDLLTFYANEVTQLTERGLPVAFAATTALAGMILGFDWESHADLSLSDLKDFVTNVVPALMRDEDDDPPAQC